MKAYIPPRAKLSKKTREAIDEVIQSDLEQGRNDMMRRFFKLMVVTLNEQFGFGEKRLYQTIGAISKLSAEHQNDPVYWEHIDMRCKQLGMELEQESYEELE